MRTRTASPAASRSLVAAWLLVALAFAGAVSGCAVVHDDAATLLGHARYPEALDRLVDEEPAAARYAPRARARYALLRGLAHLALGDARATDRWLSEAKAVYDHDPRALSDDDGGRLLDAWASLGRGRLSLSREATYREALFRHRVSWCDERPR